MALVANRNRKTATITIAAAVILVLVVFGALWTKTVLHAVDQPISGKMPTILPIKIPNPKGSVWTYSAKVTTTGANGVALRIIDKQTRGLVQTASNADPQGTAMISAKLNPLREYELIIQPAKGNTEANYTGTERHTFNLKRYRILEVFGR